MKISLNWDTIQELEKIGLQNYEYDDIEIIIKRMAQAINIMAKEIEELQNNRG